MKGIILAVKEQTGNTYEVRQFVSFRLGKEEYGIPILRVQEIIRFEALTRVPQSADHVEGVLNLRGQIIPVMDLRRRFGLPSLERNFSTRIIVVEIDQAKFGILVDCVNEVRSIGSDEIDPAPPLGTQIDAEYIEGMAKLDQGLVILLDIDNVFRAEEEKKLESVAG